jgi:hypothetical protein
LTAYDRGLHLVFQQLKFFVVYSAVHLASAEAAQVDFFITCDYTVSKRYRGTLHIITPLQFQQHYENHH